MKGKDNILMNLMYDKKISIELCDNNSGMVRPTLTITT